MTINPTGKEETIEVRLSADKHPAAYQNKVKELLQAGLSRKQAERFLLKNPFVLELYYEIGSGLFAVESEALSTTPAAIVSPYSGTPFTDPDDTIATEDHLKSLHDEFEKCRARFENSITDTLTCALRAKGIRKIDFNEAGSDDIPSVHDNNANDDRALVAAIELDDNGMLNVLLDEDTYALRKIPFGHLFTQEMYEIYYTVLRYVLPKIESREITVSADGRVVPASDI